MTMDIMNSALSGLATSRRALETTSNNISNVNTEGYSRQRIELATRSEQYTGSGYIGSGVDAVNIVRSYDQFLTDQLRFSTSAFAAADTYQKLSSQVDNLLANEATGLSPVIKSFFNAVNNVANDPSSVPARQVMLAEAGSMAKQFNNLGSRFNEMGKQVNSQLDTIVGDLNNFANALAKLNDKIVSDMGRSAGKQMPNELLDQRDWLLSNIAQKVDVSVVNQADGAVSVFIGQGQPLVLGGYASSLSVQSSKTDTTQKSILLNGQDISPQITSGELYGNLHFRDQVLDVAQQQLGSLAMGIAIEFNAIHQSGFDLNGNPGLALFDLGSPSIGVKSVAKDSNLRVTASFSAPPSAANIASYRLDVSATVPDVTYNLTNLFDGTSINDLNNTTLANATAAAGFSISFPSGVLNVGDSFKIDPAIDAARTLRINNAITSPKQVAAADMLGFSGDNRNALKLAKLETQSIMQNGKATFTQLYGQLVADIGTTTHSAQLNRDAQHVLFQRAKGARESASGVNLDEEAADLIKYQHSYQAAAHVVSIAKSLFDTLIQAVR
ncbi:flagellar hook-associated protein FlgK [Methylomonas koyamae]|uniref:Flagellar hook-associated protein 1 n=1 Tax=Methylomonas koyamae TaxID=702114 RepID=A0A177NJI5_9GAMM|nr:flagellar hook-associated protein FlgK [Methylomonas koyamae]OAI17583.1 flagellar biosynthesis protein FlgK [Methylomonas koyamae]